MKNLPKCVGIIMDGNRRWSKEKGLPLIKGYKKGISSLKEIIQVSIELNVEELSVFAFSTENWKRSNNETSLLLDLMEWYLKSEIAELHKNNIVFKSVGSKDRIPKSLKNLLLYSEEITKTNTGLNFNVALDYGGKEDLLYSVKSISKKLIEREINLKDINYELIQENLISANIKEFDLLIRTSGEKRLSNFMLWQMAYSEIYYSKLYWPDFNALEFTDALYSFSRRERRFGASLSER